MVSLQDSLSNSHCSASRCPRTRPYYYYTPPPSSAAITRSFGRSMRTIRSNVFQNPDCSPNVSENLTDSVVDLRLGQLADSPPSVSKSPSDILEISREFSSCSSDISGELQHLATLPDPYPDQCRSSEIEPEVCVESISPEDLPSTVKSCIEYLRSQSIELRRSAAAKLRLLAKNHADNRVLIGESGAIPALIPLLRCPDPMTQEHTVTALLNLSLHESNKTLISTAVKSLIYALKTGTEISKQNAACALLSVALTDETKLSIGACGAIPPLVALLIGLSSRGKKDALTTLYKLCSVRPNKERAVTAGAVGPLVELVAEQVSGLAEKATVVLSSLAGTEMGREAIVAGNGIGALVEAIEGGSDRGKELAVATLWQLCGDSVCNRRLLVGEGGIPPLVGLSLTGTGKAKHKAETLLRYLREARHDEASSSSCP